MARVEQEALTFALGGDLTQKRISLLEQKVKIESNIRDSLIPTALIFLSPDP